MSVLYSCLKVDRIVRLPLMDDKLWVGFIINSRGSMNLKTALTCIHGHFNRIVFAVHAYASLVHHGMINWG